MADEKLEVPTRQELVRRYERDYLLLNPEARVGENTLPGIDARALSDQLLPIYAEAVRLSTARDLDSTTGAELVAWATDLGLPGRLPATGASGAVQVTTSVGGATILAGAKLRHTPSGRRYQAILSGLYETDDYVSIIGIDTGPLSDLPPGTILDWAAPPFGLAQTAVVVEQSDGSGLTGGRTEETDEDIRARIRAELAEPALAGNAADYRKQALKTPGIAIQAVFTYPAVLGPGTIGLAFTLRQGTAGASRRPNATQIALVRSHLVGVMPADDSLFMYAVLDDPVDLVLRVRWARGAAGWANTDPWPTVEGDVFVDGAFTPTARTFRLSAVGGIAPPRPGHVIAFWNAAEGVFVRKTISAVTPIFGSWDVTCDALGSDGSFVPAANDRPCPWSESLAVLKDPLIAEFDKLGPSDHEAVAFDTGGLRQRREPAGYSAFPYEISGRILMPLYDVPAIDDVRVSSPLLPHIPSVGIPGSTAYLPSLRSLRAFPL